MEKLPGYLLVRTYTDACVRGDVELKEKIEAEAACRNIELPGTGSPA